MVRAGLAGQGGLAAGTATGLAREVPRPAVAAALAGLAVAVALGGEVAAAACVLGQAAAAVLVVAIVRRATEPGEAGGRGLGAVAAAWTAGMELFVLLVLGYYAAYDVALPVGNGLVPALAAALLGLAGVVAMSGPGRPGGAGRPGRDRGAVETRRRPPATSATLPTGAPATGGGLRGARPPFRPGLRGPVRV